VVNDRRVRDRMINDRRVRDRMINDRRVRDRMVIGFKTTCTISI
jgi:hypothetical protein